MLIKRTVVLAICILLAIPARADDAPEASPLPAVGDMLYKGIVGKALDAVPMDPDERLVLQRTNAVVSGTFTVRTLAAWAGLAHPVLLIAGLAWGIFAASNINAADTPAKPDTNRGEPPKAVEPEQSQVAVLPKPPLEEVMEGAR